ncbi:pyridoxal phosphate-dependent aminotransferase [Tissierella praeacuta]|uniref:pyridoxal phosphate-dependent aminotransferase n=1 Tax=Tissierella praeacuta TaxID=43131 RepID=UPI003DA441B3
MKSPYISKRYWNSISTPMGESTNLLGKYPDLINLSLGDPDLNTDERIIKKAFEDALNGHTHYTDFYGVVELRESICNFYYEEYNYKLVKEECMITTSGCHAMWLALEAILDDGDEVIIPSPYFTPYPQQVKLARGIPVFLETLEEEDFQLNMDRLENLITDRTKAIIINTPNNPTGTCLTIKTLENIASIAKKYDLLVIADDIYTIFSYEEPFIPITSLEGMRERTITISSFSKDYAMTGWRIGYILAEPYIINIIKDINENNVFTAPSISQQAAMYAIKLRKEIQPPMIKEFKARTFTAYERLKQLKNVSILPPKGTFYLFPNIKATELTSQEVAHRILEEAHVMVLPGTSFGDNGEGYIRIAATVGKDKINEAFDKIAKMEIFK